ncbi:ATP-binding protein [Bacteroidales bacterium]|nr:ATP-binding protein [Bacteroidales bacterium]
MKIDKINLVNYRGHKTTEIIFDKRMTVILGGNGSGKSAILDAISLCLSWIIARIKNPKGQGRYIDEHELYLGKRDGLVIASFDDINSIAIPNKTKKGLAKTQSAELGYLNDYCAGIRTNIESTLLKTSIPIFVHYGVRRAVLDIPLRVSKSHIFDLFETYNESLNGDASFRTFFEWFRNQEDIENERFRLEGGLFYELFGEKEDFEPGRELSTVRRALEIFLPEYKNIRVRRNPLQMLVNKSGIDLRIDQLSDGEKIYIAMIGDLCRRLVLANTILKDPLMGEGIVLIDELDLHLHPRWQTDIALRLTQVFPNVQFVVTTHSPLVVTNIASETLRILNFVDGLVSVSQSEVGYGLPTSVIMKDLMALENELPKEIEAVIRQIYTAIKENNIIEAKTLCKQLSELSPELPELVRVRKILKLQ